MPAHANCALVARTAPLRGRAGLRDRKHDNRRSIRELAPGRARALSQPAFGGSGFDRGESPSTSGKLLRASVSEDGPGRSVSVSAVSEPMALDRTNAEVAPAPGSNPETPKVRPVPRPRNPAPPVALKDLQAVVLAGGPDSGNPMTQSEARASLKLAATYRLIDFPMANIINSNLKRAFVLTQFNSYTLNQHVQHAYPPEVFGFGNSGFCDVLPSFQTPEEKDWSFGSADCVRRHLQAGALRGPHGVTEPEAYLILSGEALYRMDYGDMLETHNESGADITIAVSKRRLGEVDATNIGVCSVDPEATGDVECPVWGFREKPSLDELKEMAMCEDNGSSLDDCDVHVNMGVYIFSKKAMDDLLNVIECVEEQLDFGKHIIPMAIAAGHNVQAHAHQGYWQPIRTQRDWYDANMGLCEPRAGEDPNCVSSMIDPNFQIWTLPRCLPPARFCGDVNTEASIVSEGVVVGANSKILKSIVGPCVVLGEKVDLEGCIFIGHPEVAHLHGDDVPDVGDGAVLKNCVVHSDARVGEGCVLTNAEGVKDFDGVDKKTGFGYVIQDGIITIMQGTTIEPGTII